MIEGITVKSHPPFSFIDIGQRGRKPCIICPSPYMVFLMMGGNKYDINSTNFVGLFVSTSSNNAHFFLLSINIPLTTIQRAAYTLTEATLQDTPSGAATMQSNYKLQYKQEHMEHRAPYDRQVAICGGKYLHYL